MTRIHTARTIVRAHRQLIARQGLRPLPFFRPQPAGAEAALDPARWARILAESGWADEDPAFMASLREELPG